MQRVKEAVGRDEDRHVVEVEVEVGAGEGEGRRISDGDEEFASGYLKRWAQAVERRLAEIGAGPFTAGENIHVVDIKLYMAVRWFASGNVDHVPRDVFAGFPPKIVAWYAR